MIKVQVITCSYVPTYDQLYLIWRLEEPLKNININYTFPFFSKYIKTFCVYYIVGFQEFAPDITKR